VPRSTRLTIDSAIPVWLRGQTLQVTGLRYGPQQDQPEPIAGSFPFATDQRFGLQYDLEPETIYTLQFVPSAHQIPALNTMGACLLIVLLGWLCRRRTK